jgi:hypothetical protein
VATIFAATLPLLMPSWTLPASTKNDSPGLYDRFYITMN